MKTAAMGIACLAAGAVLAVPTGASAAPTGSPLPDADVFCGPSLAEQVTFAFNSEQAATFWITGGSYVGKWNIAWEAHYVAGGTFMRPVPLTQLADNPATYQLTDQRSFGTKAGQIETTTCEIVSRWPAGTVAPTAVTVFAPLTLTRT